MTKVQIWNLKDSKAVDSTDWSGAFMQPSQLETQSLRNSAW